MSVLPTSGFWSSKHMYTVFIHTINAEMDSDINANYTDTQKFVEFPAIPLVKPDQSEAN